jgi:hypothetical protein
LTPVRACIFEPFLPARHNGYFLILGFLQEAYHGQRQEEKGQMLRKLPEKRKDVFQLSFERQGKRKVEEKG